MRGWIVASALTVTAGCGEEPFVVQETEPASGATGVDPEGTVQVTFSREVDPDSVDETSFRLLRDGEPVPGTVTYDEATRTATFTPATRLTLLATYEASVTEAVTDAQGDGLPPSGWTFLIAAGTWAPAHLMGTGSATESPAPQVAVDAAGNAMAVWKQSDGAVTSIWARRYIVEIEWEDAQLLELDDAGSAENPRIASDAQGNAIAVWVQSDGTRANAWSHRYVAGTGWGSAELLETDDTAAAADARIGIDAAGNAIAVWTQADELWARRYVAGTGWESAVAVEADPEMAPYNPQVGIGAGGAAIVVWEGWPLAGGTAVTIMSNTYSPETGWGTATPAESDDLGSFGPHVGIDAQGNAVAVWHQYAGKVSSIWGNRYLAGAGWGTARAIDVDDQDFARDAQVVVDPNGNAIAVWDEALRIRSARYDVTTNTWSGEELISDEGNGQYPRLGIDGGGNVVAVWADRSFVLCNRYVAGQGWLGVTMIEVPVGGAAEAADIAVDPGGNAIAIWTHTSEDTLEMQALASTFR
jgi:hypothetical protein